MSTENIQLGKNEITIPRYPTTKNYDLGMIIADAIALYYLYKEEPELFRGLLDE